jgi:hypothetical protein
MAIQWARPMVTVAARVRISRSLVLAVGVGVLVVSVHLYRLTQVPSGFFSDEAGIGYAAWGIASDGRDDHGVSWPLFFQSFGDWKNPVEIYITALIVRLGGLSVFTVRLAPALLGALTSFLMAGFAWSAFERRWLAMAMLAVAGCLPGLFVVSRTGFEVIALPCLLAGFLWAWHEARRRGSGPLAWLAGGSLGLATYAYSTGRLLVPLLLLAMVAAEWPQRRLRLLLRPLAMGTLWLMPLVLFEHFHAGALTERFQLISIFNLAQTPWDMAADFWRVYSSYFSPAYLFQTAWFQQGGQLFMALIPLLGLGLVELWQRRSDPFWRLVGLALVLSPVPAALTFDFGHPYRNVSWMVFWLAVAGLGAWRLEREMRPRQRALAVVLIGALSLEAASFMADYFTRYGERSSGYNEEGFAQAVQMAENDRAGRRVLVSSRILGGDILYAWTVREALVDYRRGGVGALNVEVADLSRPPPQGVIVIAKPEEKVEGELLGGVTVQGSDAWGRQKSVPRYDVWRT